MKCECCGEEDNIMFKHCGRCAGGLFLRLTNCWRCASCGATYSHDDTEHHAKYPGSDIYYEIWVVR